MSNEPPKYPRITKQLRHLPVASLPRGWLGRPITAPESHLCKLCGKPFDIPWHAKFNQEAVVGRPDSLRAIPVLFFRCPNCSVNNVIKINVHPRTNWRHLRVFGDESVFERAGHVFFIYVLVSSGPVNLDLARGIWNFKKTVRPNADPATWTMHMQPLRQRGGRRALGITLDSPAINQACRVLAEHGAVSQETYVYVTLSNYDDRDKNNVRDETISSAIHMAVEDITEAGFSCSFVLEALENKHPDELSDLYVERLSRGLFCNPAFIWDCRGCDVDLPITMPKHARPELEYADFVAYWVNRHFRQAADGKECELALTRLGRNIRWSLKITGGWDSRRIRGVPDYPIVVPSE